VFRGLKLTPIQSSRSSARLQRNESHALSQGKIRRRGREEFMANTKSITDKAERKKVKRTARKKATPKAKRTYARGSEKRKVKKLARGQSKR
jgi:hypothetical protein